TPQANLSRVPSQTAQPTRERRCLRQRRNDCVRRAIVLQCPEECDCLEMKVLKGSIFRQWHFSWLDGRRARSLCSRQIQLYQLQGLLRELSPIRRGECSESE